MPKNLTMVQESTIFLLADGVFMIVMNVGILRCHVRECDILTEFKRCKPNNLPRWKGGRTIRLEVSDHVPVSICFEGVPDLPFCSVLSFAVRYVPEVCGHQQTLVSLLMKKANAVEVDGESSSLSSKSLSFGSCEDVKLSSQMSGVKSLSFQIETYTHLESKKRTKHGRCSQPTLTSFFQKNAPCTNVIFSTPAEAVTFEESYVPSKFSEGTNSILNILGKTMRLMQLHG